MSRILIVQQDGTGQAQLWKWLAEEDHTLTTVQTCAEARHLLDEGPVDLVISSIELSDGTGADLLRHIRGHSIEAPVVLLTSQPDVKTAAEALRLGAFDYLSTTVAREELLRVVRLGLQHKALAEERDNYAMWMEMYRRDLEAIFNSVLDGIVTVVPSMSILQANTKARDLLGLPRREMLTGMPFDTVMPPGAEPAGEALRHTLKTREAVGESRIEVVLTENDRKTLVIKTTPLISEGGEFSGALLMIRDITRLVSLERQLEDSQHYRDMVGKSERMQEIFTLIKQLAETDSTVLIRGESGTGKELVAEALHHASVRAAGPFVRVNCAALSESILESELFGHVKGAFTGAIRDRVGRFEAAHGGTILLDEIGDVSPRLQLRLLRVLQDREFERVGESRPVRTDVRVIAATHQDLPARIAEGEFRQDLYYRLNVVCIEIPPLRERLDDLPLLIEHFCRRFNRAFHKEVSGVSSEAMQMLMRYHWPGNVRELENCMERAFIVCNGPRIRQEHLPPEVRRDADVSVPAPSSVKMEHAEARKPIDRDRIVQTLSQTDWNVAKTARLLGISRNTLYTKMRRMSIERPKV